MEITEFMLELDTSDSTAAKYGEVLKYLEAWLIDSGLELEDVGVAQYRRFRKAKGWGNAYERLCLIALKRYLRWAELSEHPLLKFNIKRTKGKKPRAYFPDEMEQIIAAIDRNSKVGKRGYPMLMLQYDTGLRSQELCRLELADTDLEKCELGVFVKGGDWEDKVFSERTADALRMWLKDRARFITNGTTKMFVSVGGNTPGHKLTVNGLRAIYRKMGKQAGFELSPHDIRRSFAIAAVLSGAPIPVVMKQGGWTNLQVFMAYLERLMPADFSPYLPTNGVEL